MEVSGQSIQQQNNYRQAYAQPKQQVQTGCCNVASAPTTNYPQVYSPPSVTVQPNNVVCNSCNATYPQVQYQPDYAASQSAVYTSYQPSVNAQPCQAGVNIQIFNPSVGTPGAAPVYNVNSPSYPSNYYTDDLAKRSVGENNEANSKSSSAVTSTSNTSTTKTVQNKKTEKRKIVELTDDYIKNLETYLNSQDKAVRLNAAKEVYARLKEDESRCDDKALNALINKMLQDPSQEVRFLALAALDERIATGDAYTVDVLKKIQANSTDGIGMEAADANSILLKMSAKQVEKEFEVKEKNGKKANEMSDKFKPEGAKLQ